jgi:RNA polymerase sigma-70 factor (ECF subfamily)
MSTPTLEAEALLENQGWLFQFVRRLVADDYTADDIVQSTFEQALLNKENKGSHRGWLKGVAHNLVKEYHRSSSRRRRREEFIATGTESVADAPNEILEMASFIMSAIERLPEDQKKVILLRHMLVKKPAEIARILELPKETVYRHLERGCKRVQADLKQRHGLDWRVNCAAVLGFKLPGLWSATKVIGVAAMLSIAAVGTWFGLHWLSDDKPLEPAAIEATLPLVPASAGPTDAGEAVSAGFAMEAELFRENKPTPLAPFHGSIARVLLPDQSAVPYVEVIAAWGPNLGLSNSFVTDEDGFAQIILPGDVFEFSLRTKVPGYLNPRVSCTADQLGNVVQVPLIKGSFSQPLRAVDYRGNGLEGVLLQTSIPNGLQGYFLSGPDGHVEALLAGPGVYSISMDDNQAFDPLDFEVDARSTQQHHEIPCVIPATDVRLRAVDNETGETLTSVGFWGKYQPRDEFGASIGDRLEIQMASINGTLEYSGTLFEPQIYAVVIRAPGFAPKMVTVFQNPETELVIGLDRQHSRPARIILPGSGNHVVSATIHRREKAVTFPAQGVAESSSISKTTFGSPLVVDSQGGFQLPFEEQGQSNFRLVVIDDQDTHYSSWVIANELLPNNAGEFVFYFDPPAVQELSLQLVDDQNRPQAGVSIQTFFDDRRDSQPPSKETDANGIVQLKVIPGEDIELNFDVNNINVQGSFPAPLQGQESNLILQLPACSNSLMGEVVLADGQVANATISSKWQGVFDLHLPGGGTAPMLISARGKTNGGQFLIEGVPAGVYVTTATKSMRRNGTKTTVDQHLVDTPTLFQFPPVVEYKFRVSDAQGNRINANFRSYTNTTVGVDLDKARSTLTGGVAHFEIEESIQVHAMLVMAKGYAPYYALPHVSNELVDITLETPGRDFMILDTAAEGIILEEGKFWIVDAWGDASDPRQGLVYEFYAGNDLRVSGTPLGEFNFVEVDSTGRPTSRVINVPAL